MTSRSLSRKANHQSGFTLVEVLVSLAICAITMSLATSGLKQSLRVAQSIYQESSFQPLSEMQSISRLLSQTMAATEVDTHSGLGHLLFKGDERSLEFVTLSDGYAIPGGLIKVRIIFGQDETSRPGVRLYYAPFRPLVGRTQMDGPWLLSDQIVEMSFRYYGVKAQGQQPEWYNEWDARDILPYAVDLHLVVQAKNGENAFSLLCPLRTSQNPS